METATSSQENKRYNDESNFLDGLYEFHPEFFKELTEQELEVLHTYYLVERDVPENVFVYRRELTQKHPRLEDEAHQVFNKILELAGIEGFHYSHD